MFRIINAFQENHKNPNLKLKLYKIISLFNLNKLNRVYSQITILLFKQKKNTIQYCSNHLKFKCATKNSLDNLSTHSAYIHKKYKVLKKPNANFTILKVLYCFLLNKFKIKKKNG